MTLEYAVFRHIRSVETGYVQLGPILLRPSSTQASSTSTKFYSGQVLLMPSSTHAKFYSGQVLLRPSLKNVCALCVSCVVCFVRVLCVLCVSVRKTSLRQTLLHWTPLRKTTPQLDLSSAVPPKMSLFFLFPAPKFALFCSHWGLLFAIFLPAFGGAGVSLNDPQRSPKAHFGWSMAAVRDRDSTRRPPKGKKEREWDGRCK